jgi:hypothetical protein
MKRIAASEVKKGNHVILENRPSRITVVIHSKIGKHGHAKTYLEGVDCINKNKYCMTFPGDPKVFGFDPIRRKLQLTSINDEGKDICIDCIDEKSTPITIDINRSCETIVNDIKNVMNNDANKILDINIVSVPVPESNNKNDENCEFEYENIIESFSEQKE